MEKKVFTYQSGWSVTDCRRFIYYNWLPLLELEVDDPGGQNETITILRKYTWGLDLSTTLVGAGGIGGLLATHDADASKDYIYLYDANGNVGQLVDLSDGSTAAKYEYDAYGNLTASSGPFADANPFRFSTKYYDAETDNPATTTIHDGLSYFGYRYYSPRLGRWISRDPLGEFGAPNLLAFADNAPTVKYDPDGRQTTQPKRQVKVKTKDCGTWTLPDGTPVSIRNELRRAVQKTCDWLDSRLAKLEDPEFEDAIQACLDINTTTNGLSVRDLVSKYRKVHTSACINAREFHCKDNCYKPCKTNRETIMVTVSSWGRFKGRPIIVCTDNIKNIRKEIGDNPKNMLHELLRWWVGDEKNAAGQPEIQIYDVAFNVLNRCWQENEWSD